MHIRFSFKTVSIILLLIVLVGGIWFSFFITSILRDLPRPEQIGDIKQIQSTKIYDRTGEVLLYEIHGDQNRTVLPDNEIPDVVKNALVALEDQGFYSHSAIDWHGFLRAVFVNILSVLHIGGSGSTPGGSTITQQLAKNVFLTPEKTISRKIKEFILAYWIEQRYSKDQILSLYLNQVSYGSNAYGVQSAAQMFFGKNASDLSIAQAALLAGVLQAPSYYSPWGNHVDELLARKDYTLSQMQKLDFIDQQEYEAAKAEPIEFVSQTIGSIRAPHFVIMVKEYLERVYGKELVENGGLRVVTTLDWNLQEEAQSAITEGVARNKELYNGSNASLVAQDPKTGQILALVGSANYFDNDIDGQFNVATQGVRQPGSSFKPFVYLTAFEEGYLPSSIIFDVPTEFAPNNPNCPSVVNFDNSNPACFHPQNYDSAYRGPISLQDALAQSINVPAVKVLYLAGLSNSITTAQKFGITTLTDTKNYGLSLVLGGGAVRLVDMVNAYSVFAQGGIKHTQSFILRVEKNSGEVLESYSDTPTRVADQRYVNMINTILSSVSLRSGLFHSSLPLTVFNGYDVALKTGTTNDYRDAWSIGYTPFITVGVWAGNSNYKPMQQQGGSILAAVPIWSSFMRQAINNYKPEGFSVYDDTDQSFIPMIDGSYVITRPQDQSPQIHSILYYIDKNDPATTRDSTNPPNNDPQFYNWELPILNWAQINIPNFLSSYNKNPSF